MENHIDYEVAAKVALFRAFDILANEHIMTEKELSAWYLDHPYVIRMDPANGKKYVTLESVRGDVINLSCDGNDKTGPVYAFNLPPFYSCVHDCECYRLAKCYAMAGCYQFPRNMRMYSENMRFFLEHTATETAAQILARIIRKPNNALFRHFTGGDIPNQKYLDIMIIIAKSLPFMRMWSYTKKYSLVNRFVDAFGLAAIPENLTLIFSHWLNEDGTFYPMDNPHSFPTSEYIPNEKKELAKNATFICPCSDPSVFCTCATCEKSCPSLQHGQSMALLEHSTPETREQDQAIRAAKAEVKKTVIEHEKQVKRENRTATRAALADLRERLKTAAA